MDLFRVLTNGERVNEVENLATASSSSSIRVVSQSQSSQLPHDNHRVEKYHLNSPSLSSVDLQIGESLFGRFDVSDSSVCLKDNNIKNRYNQVINSSDNEIHLNSHHRELELEVFSQIKRLSSEINLLYGSHRYDAKSFAMLNNDFSNEVSHNSRNRVSSKKSRDEMNGYLSRFNKSWRSYERFNGSHYLDDEGNSLIIAISKDEEFNEQLKMKIDNSSQEIFDLIFTDLFNHVLDLMVDPFGINVFGSLMRKCSYEQVTQIINMVTLNNYQFRYICSDLCGSIAMQLLVGAIHIFRGEQITPMVEAIRLGALELTRNKYAHDVILKCFRMFHVSQYRNILDVIVENCYRIAIDQHGYILLQQALTINCYELRKRLTSQIIINAFELSMDQLGNYVVQYLVQMGNREVIEMLVMKLSGKYTILSCSKYGSHVVQKLLAIKEFNYRIVYDLLRDIKTLVVDPFGNYVIQTVWFKTQGFERSILANHIKRNVGLMRCNVYGNKLLRKFNL